MGNVWVLLVAVFWVGQSSAQDALPDAPNQVHPLMVGDEVPALTLVDNDVLISMAKAVARDFEIGR